MLAASLLVVHDTSGGGQDDVAELTGGKELGSPLLEVTELDGVAGVDDTALVETGARIYQHEDLKEQTKHRELTGRSAG